MLERQQVEEERSGGCLNKTSYSPDASPSAPRPLGEGVPGWPCFSEPFIRFPNTRPGFLLPALSDTAINILPAFHRAGGTHTLQIKRGLRWQHAAACRPALVECGAAGSPALDSCWKMEGVLQD